MAAWDPIYIPTITYYGGVYGDDAGRPDKVTGMPFSTANCTNDFTPRSQNDKLTAGNLGNISWTGSPATPATTAAVASVDVTTPRGAISPNERYPVTGDAAVPAPVVSSISPTTAAAGALPTLVTITGTGFTPDSRVHTGGQGNAALSGQYVSATQMKVTIQAGTAPGAVTISVEDHSVLSGTQTFTVT